MASGSKQASAGEHRDLQAVQHVLYAPGCGHGLHAVRRPEGLAGVQGLLVGVCSTPVSSLLQTYLPRLQSGAGSHRLLEWEARAAEQRLAWHWQSPTLRQVLLA